MIRLSARLRLGAPLEGAEHALVGTMQHGVLGERWAYDGCHDPVLVGELLSLIQGRAQAMAQSISDTADHEVVRSYTGAPFPLDAFAPEPADGSVSREPGVSCRDGSGAAACYFATPRGECMP